MESVLQVCRALTVENVQIGYGQHWRLANQLTHLVAVGHSQRDHRQAGGSALVDVPAAFALAEHTPLALL